MTGSLKIKVCGMKDPANLEQVCNLEPDFVGFIFFKGSMRYVGDQPDKALFSIPENRVFRVGVFVNEPLLSVQRIIDSGWVDMVQLHGSESPEYCKTLVNGGVHVIKAVNPARALTLLNFNPEFPGDSDSLKAYYGVTHYFLFDSAGEGHGGTGRKFDWDLIRDYTLPVPFLLSGGIGPGDGPAIRELDLLWFHGVDVNSRFETVPGQKNIEQLENFMNEIRK